MTTTTEAGTQAPSTQTATNPAHVEVTRVSDVLNMGMDEFAAFSNIPQEDESGSDAETAEEVAKDALKDGVPELEEGISPEEFAEREKEEGKEPVAKEEAKAEDAKESKLTEDSNYITPKKLDRKPATEFAIETPEGEIEIPDLTIKFTANGKERSDPLDVVVRMAQQGAYNEEREAQVKEFRTREPQYQQTINSLQTEYRALVQGAAEMLANPQIYEAERQAYFAANSPEAQLQATRQELIRIQQQQREQQTIGAETQHAQQFVATLAPRLEAMVQQHPEVSFEEAFGKFSMLTAPYLVQGRIPPSRFPQIQSLVESELLPWIDHTASVRATRIAERQKEATKPLQDAVTKKTADAMAAKRQVTRALKPQGSASPSTPKPQTLKTATDIMGSIADIALGTAA